MYDRPVAFIAHKKAWEPPCASIESVAHSLSKDDDKLMYFWTKNALLLFGSRGKQEVSSAYKPGRLGSFFGRNRYTKLVQTAVHQAVVHLNRHHFEDATIDLMIASRLEEHEPDKPPSLDDLLNQKRKMYEQAVVSKENMEHMLMHLLVKGPSALRVVKDMASPEEFEKLGVALFDLYWGDVQAEEWINMYRGLKKIVGVMIPEDPHYHEFKEKLVKIECKISRYPCTNLFTKLPDVIQHAVDALADAKKDQSRILAAAMNCLFSEETLRDRRTYLRQWQW